MLRIVYLLLVALAAACAGTSLAFPWSIGGLFVPFGLLAQPLDILLVYTQLWAALFPALLYLVIVTCALQTLCLLLTALFSCWPQSSPHNLTLRRWGILVAAAALSLSVTTGLTAVLVWSALTVLPPGLWGGRWGPGAILFSVATGLAASLTCLATRSLPPQLLPPPLPLPLPQQQQQQQQQQQFPQEQHPALSGAAPLPLARLAPTGKNDLDWQQMQQQQQQQQHMGRA